ncbi:MAG: hypothetical protein CVU57_30840 [Deltaproteobacteria bacterium HGW-Deltaproteobacteria-15]|nr:MAG: hypothetical protein CVU57_30840 [Deltaproteobacteria bacterium HGW-Deltaproteobacteria-15]
MADPPFIFSKLKLRTPTRNVTPAQWKYRIFCIRAQIKGRNSEVAEGQSVFKFLVATGERPVKEKETRGQKSEDRGQQRQRQGDQRKELPYKTAIVW